MCADMHLGKVLDSTAEVHDAGCGRRYWPEEERQWVEGLITDYRADADEHAITYEINTPRESFEWFSIRCAALMAIWPPMKQLQHRSCPLWALPVHVLKGLLCVGQKG